LKRLDIVVSFLKVGLMGFGGGSALIPVVERELVQSRGALGEREYLTHTVIANITPGALPVKLGASCGWLLGGVPGCLAGTWAVALPGVLLTVMGMALFRVLGQEALRYVGAASAGVSAFIIFLLGGYVHKAAGGGERRINLPICAGAFILTGGRELRSLIALAGGLEPGTPLLDISTVTLMILAFFGIFAAESAGIPRPLAALAGGAYAFFSGAYSRARGWELPGRLSLLAMVLLCAGFFLARKKSRPGTGGNPVPAGTGGPRGPGPGKAGPPPAGKRAALLITLLLLPALAGTLGAAALTPVRDVAGFMLRICLSTLSSFGGGEAYISVADGFFVQTGLIPPEIFYTRLVPLANALPGPILVKVAAGGAFVFGLGKGSPAGACLMAAAAAAAVLGLCGTIAVLGLMFYERLGTSRLAAGLTRYMLPVIAGMLLSTSCSILYEGLKILGAGPRPRLSLGIMAGWTAVLFVITRRRHIPGVLLLLLSAGLGLLLA
jgi:chromate transporter